MTQQTTVKKVEPVSHILIPHPSGGPTDCFTVPEVVVHPDYKENTVNSADFFAQYQPVIDFVIKHNQSNGTYHTTHHLLGVAWLAWLTSILSDEYRTHTAIVYAALFHDFCHPVNNDDAKNIETTLTAMDEHKAWDVIPKDLHFDVRALIRGTQWPMPEGLQLYGEMELLRDVDQLYATYFFDDVMSERLFREMGPRFGVTSYAEWLGRNMDYVLDLRGGFNWDIVDRFYELALENVIRIQTHLLVHLVKAQ